MLDLVVEDNIRSSPILTSVMNLSCRTRREWRDCDAHMGGLAKAPLGDDPLLALGWKSKHHKRDRTSPAATRTRRGGSEVRGTSARRPPATGRRLRRGGRGRPGDEQRRDVRRIDGC